MNLRRFSTYANTTCKNGEEMSEAFFANMIHAGRRFSTDEKYTLFISWSMDFREQIQIQFFYDGASKFLFNSVAQTLRIENESKTYIARKASVSSDEDSLKRFRSFGAQPASGVRKNNLALSNPFHLSERACWPRDKSKSCSSQSHTCRGKILIYISEVYSVLKGPL